MEGRLFDRTLGTLPSALALLRSSAVIVVAVIGSACSALVGETPVMTGSTSEATRVTESASRRCAPASPGTVTVDTGSAAGDALFLAGELFTCSDDVVVVDQGNLNELAIAAQLAAALEAPILFPEPRLAAEIGRLKPLRVHLLGVVEVTTPPSAEVIRHDLLTAAQSVKSALKVSAEVTLPATPDASTVVGTVQAIVARDRVAVPQPQPASTVTAPPPPEISVRDVIDGLAGANSAEAVWIVDGRDAVSVLLASAVGPTVGAVPVAIDGQDVLGYPVVAEAVGGRPPGELRFVGGQPDASEWELRVLTNGAQVPGGGFRILPQDGKRRYVAFYGFPGAAELGVLGEQSPTETLQRMQPFLEAYAADGSQTIPTFEMIVSVASAGPTEDGDYSFEWATSTFEEWISAARENDGYVILDLQPGRDDFLSQAMLYEELLKLPFVGLAIDPEWRLKPEQVHLQQVGQVEASEVNQVIHWLADLVRDNGLPQKLIIVHQFRTSMIQDREILEQRPELQLVIQMDGDGTEAQKDSTFNQLKVGAENAFWSWGWKNFFDEDEPAPPTPESTMSKEPSPVYISYQ